MALKKPSFSPGRPQRDYPGYVIKTETKDARVVRAVQRRLNSLGYGPLDVNGTYGRTTRDAVKLFQARATDLSGSPLKVDGIIGPLTWGGLFGGDAQITARTTRLLREVLSTAAQQVGVLETPPGSNRGREVDEYVRSVGLDPAGKHPWCAAFVYWCFQQASNREGIPNPAIRTAGVLDHWTKAGQSEVHRILSDDVEEDITLLKPGLIFVIRTGNWQGHMGLVADYREGKLVTIEGNTSVDGNPEGIGVFRRHGRKLADINKGYIDYGEA